MDVVICASTQDVHDWLAVSLRQLFRHCAWVRRVHVVTPRPGPAEEIVAGLPDGWRRAVTVLADGTVCPEAIGLPPWYRQQYIKLHADRVAAGEHFAVLGADTLLLDPIHRSDLMSANGTPRLRFFRYAHPARHLDFERSRVLNVATLLGVDPARSFLPGDFICDLFVMRRSVLVRLRDHLAGSASLLGHLHSLGEPREEDSRFGEWTLYAVYALDVLDPGTALEFAGHGWFAQVHSANDLRRTGWHKAKIVHFAHAPDGATAVLRALADRSRLARPA